jgi:hypothetical protein
MLVTYIHIHASIPGQEARDVHIVLVSVGRRWDILCDVVIMLYTHIYIHSSYIHTYLVIYIHTHVCIPGQEARDVHIVFVSVGRRWAILCDVVIVSSKRYGASGRLRSSSTPSHGTTVCKCVLCVCTYIPVYMYTCIYANMYGWSGDHVIQKAWCLWQIAELQHTEPSINIHTYIHTYIYIYIYTRT